MGGKKRGQGKSSVTNRTRINSVSGAVSTGSGSIYVGSLTFSANASTQEDIVSALHQFRTELAAARERGLPQDTTERANVEVVGAEREARKNRPNAQEVLDRLGKAKAVLVAGTGVATATAAAAAEAGKLLPLLESVIEAVRKILGA